MSSSTSTCTAKAGVVLTGTMVSSPPAAAVRAEARDRKAAARGPARSHPRARGSVAARRATRQAPVITPDRREGAGIPTPRFYRAHGATKLLGTLAIAYDEPKH